MSHHGVCQEDFLTGNPCTYSWHCSWQRAEARSQSHPFMLRAETQCSCSAFPRALNANPHLARWLGSCSLASQVRTNSSNPLPWVALSHRMTHAHLGRWLEQLRPLSCLLRGAAAAGTFAKGTQEAACSHRSRCPAPRSRCAPLAAPASLIAAVALPVGVAQRCPSPPKSSAGSCSFAGGLDAPCIPHPAAA